jgi:hypothetical protein
MGKPSPITCTKSPVDMETSDNNTMATL